MSDDAPRVKLSEVNFDPFASPELSITTASTEAQREIWAAARMDDSASAAFNQSISLELKGEFDFTCFQAAVADLVARHDALRTTFSSDGLTLCVATQSLTQVQFVDLCALDERERNLALSRARAKAVEAPFDLTLGPLFRVQVLKCHPAHHVAIVSAHHIVCDGWSVAVLLRDLGVLYSARATGRNASLPEAPSFASYARAEVDEAANPERAAAERYWLSQLSGSLPTLELPLDGARPPSRTWDSLRQDYALDAALVASVKQLGARNGVSLFGTLLGAFYILLARLTRDEDIIVGIPAAGQSVTGLVDLVGHCVNTLPLRVPLDPNQSLSDFLKVIRSTMLDAYDHQRSTFGTLVKKLRVTRDPSRLPLVSALFNLDQAIDGADLAFEGLEVAYSSNPRSFETFEIFVSATETKGRIVLECQFNTNLFSSETIVRWLSAYEQLLRSMIQGDKLPIASLSVLPNSERAQVVYEWNATFRDFPRTLTVSQLIERQAQSAPDAVVLECEGQALTHGELERRANQLARRLREQGVQRGVFVGLCLERSVEMVVALLGILKAGGTYVPLDPGFPKDRIAFMIQDSGMPVVVTQQKLVDELAPLATTTPLCLDTDAATVAAQSSEPLALSELSADPESLAYVIYTSGSTGVPKGVCVPHRSVVNFLVSMAREPGLTASDVVVAVTTLSFDIAVLELLLPLAVGARVAIATRATAMDGVELKRLLASAGATVMQATPATWRLLLDAGWKGDPNFKALSGGEALPRHLASELLRRTGSLWNMYGPTETTVWSTCYKVEKSGAPILIGKPIDNTRVYVLDDAKYPVPVGVPGELFIAGDGVTHGYLKRPELTDAAFLPDPFANEPGAKMYKTGDLVRFVGDGNLEYIRRNDTQVKVRGYRIELGEIESSLVRAPGVKQAVVVLRQAHDDTRLAAYLVASGSQSSDDVLRAHVRQQLPDYMVPQHFVWLNELPLTPNGKIDRRALPALNLDEQVAKSEFVAPRTEAEGIVVEVFQDVLTRQRVSVDDNFFDLGGHSLLAAQVFSRLERNHGVVIPFRKIFEAPTPAALAKLIGDATGQGVTGRVAAIPRRDDSVPAPLSLMQQRLWMLDQLDPGLAVQNLPAAFRIRGKLDPAVFERALNRILERHESPRTTFAYHEGEAFQRVQPELWIPLNPPVDLSHKPPNEREAEMLHLMAADAASPFDLLAGPLVRGALYCLSSEEHVFYWNAHHTVWDGWSFDIFLHELDVLYAAFTSGKEPELPELPIRYQDFADWHRQWLQGDNLERESEFWFEHLSGELPILDMPTDFARPPKQSHVGGTEEFFLTKAEVASLNALGRRADATLYMVFLAAFQTLLYRYTGQEDVIVGTPVRGRSRPETENLLGFFVNTLTLRVNASGSPSFLDMLERTRRICLDAFEHPEMPFEVLVQKLDVERDLSRTPLFQAFFTFQDVSNRVSRFGDLSYSRLHVYAPVAATDLFLWVQETGDGLVGGIDYASDLFERATIARFLKQLRELLFAACEDPHQPISSIRIVPEAERRAILAVNATEAAFPRDKGVHHLVAARAAKHPERTAAVFKGASLTFGELDERADRLASVLQAQGAGPGALVGLFLERSHEMLISMLAVLKSGAGYVPLDPSFPSARLAFMVEDSKLGLIVSQTQLLERLPPHQARVVCVDSPANESVTSSTAYAPWSSESPAYVIYTSGSTGKPKGVVVPHRAVVNFLTSVAQTPGLQESDTLLAVTTLSFDIAVLELWLPAIVGAKIILASADDSSDGDRLLDLIRSHEVSVLQATPGTFKLLIAAGLKKGDLKQVLVGGEAVPPDLVGQLVERVDSVWNMYGPTETTVWSTCAHLTSAESVPIGRPLQNTRVFVVDQNRQLCPFGVRGELWIGGDGVTLGYLGRPELTEERFPEDPFEAKGRLYRTGDLVRLLEDGNLVYERRNDTQIKLRGYRIELGEIEASLKQHPAIQQAVALVREDNQREVRLVAYLVKSGDVTDSELREHLRGFLPPYMVPQHFVELGELPLTPNGKIDKNALPEVFSASTPDDDFVAPGTENERAVAEIWSAALAIPDISVHDNFFDIGGHSLLALKVIARIEQQFEVRLNPRVLLLNSLAQVAAQLPGSEHEPSVGPPSVRPPPPSSRRPFMKRLLRKVKERVKL